MEEPAYPPEPWHLRGRMYVSVRRVAPDRLPRWRLPPGARPLIVGGRCTLLVFWVDYRPDGVLAYRELLVAPAVVHRRRIRATAVAVWVDSPASRAGGRALWGIPKELGDLGADAGRFRLRAPGPGSVSGEFTAGRVTVPVRRPLRATLVQWRGAEVVDVPVALSGRLTHGRLRMTADPAGTLAFLTDDSPRPAVRLDDFRCTVGRPRD
ncbi:acetoacetate decarboxylase family protein [Streptomyces cinereospinus]|uniref:Acetoacetate decarboxylase family protein n=1 Tax=Streptomyces cinereospinus TaxID=285561 RepID=A0ABV5MUQ7_9ACTN